MDPILNAGLSRGITVLMAPAARTPRCRAGRPGDAEAAVRAVASAAAPRRRSSASGGLRAVTAVALVAAGNALATAGRRLAGTATVRPEAVAPLPRGCG